MNIPDKMCSNCSNSHNVRQLLTFVTFAPYYGGQFLQLSEKLATIVKKIVPIFTATVRIQGHWTKFFCLGIVFSREILPVLIVLKTSKFQLKSVPQSAFSRLHIDN
jgi:hypothetical protein